MLFIYKSLVRQRIYDAIAVTQDNTYNDVGRLTRLATTKDANDLVNFEYSYDKNGNITGQQFDHRTLDPTNSYSYDDLDRLTRSDYLDDPNNDNEVFTYDDLGNRLTHTTRAGSDVAYSHNTVNEYTVIGGNTITHDAAGNLTTDKDSYTYHYDHDNRLTQVRKTSDTVNVASYTYDALGRRIEKIDHVGSSTTRYYYDGWRVLTETDAAATPNHLRDYVYGNYLDEVLVKIENSNDIYYAHNHLFSVVALLDDTGEVIERYEYDVYGKVTFLDSSYNVLGTQQSGYGNDKLFTGKELDLLDARNLGLANYNNRVYKPGTGRFLQRDPSRYIDGMNLYEYVGSNPVINLDPSGNRILSFGKPWIEIKGYWLHYRKNIFMGVGWAGNGISEWRCFFWQYSYYQPMDLKVAESTFKGALSHYGWAHPTNGNIQLKEGLSCRKRVRCKTKCCGTKEQGGDYEAEWEPGTYVYGKLVGNTGTPNQGLSCKISEGTFNSAKYHCKKKAADRACSGGPKKKKKRRCDWGSI